MWRVHAVHIVHVVHFVHDAHTSVTLSWTEGLAAESHTIYIGDDFNDVNDAAAGEPQTETTCATGMLEKGTTYYWRVDELNTDGTITKGRLWQFTVADFILVDDFEAYNDVNPEDEGSNRIYATWIDGWGTEDNGAVVGYAAPDFTAGRHFVETQVIHGGRQSMPYLYDGGKGYSEAVMSLTYPRDWTEQGVEALTLWFRGYSASLFEEPAGTYTVSASGADISGTADQFRYVYRQLTGPGSIQVRVLNIENTHEWAKAGVMIRATPDPSSAFAGVYLTPGYGCRFQGRPFFFGDTMSDSPVATPGQTAIAAPYWVKLERTGANEFRGYYSADGIAWTAMSWNPQVINMPPDVHIGLALTSHNVNAVCKARFSDVQVTGSVTPQTWTVAAIGAEMPGNDAEPMYVAIANKNSPAAAVYHPDAKAAQIDVWTSWTIDLKSFAEQGVKLTNVDSIAIGFGDKNNPRSGGAGRVYFDDIRLYRAR